MTSEQLHDTLARGVESYEGATIFLDFTDALLGIRGEPTGQQSSDGHMHAVWFAPYQCSAMLLKLGLYGNRPR